MAINKWVEEQTKEKIEEILKKGVVNAGTRLVIANALYFKAAWEEPFLKEQTKDAEFEQAPERISRADDVCQVDSADCAVQRTVSGWNCPTSGVAFSMVLVLPQKKRNLADLEKTLTPMVVQKILHQAERNSRRGLSAPFQGDQALRAGRRAPEPWE